MANDTIKQDVVTTTFVSGEQPSASKLNAAFSHLQTQITKVAGAVGDIYSQQSFLNGLSTEYNPSILPQVGPNLGRVVGSAGWLNPRHCVAPFDVTAPFGPVYSELYVTFAGGQSLVSDPPRSHGWRHWNQRQFTLPKPPILVTSSPEASAMTASFSHLMGSTTYFEIQAPGAGYTDATASGTGKVTTRVTNLDDLAAAGDYHVSFDGTITLYSRLDPYAAGGPEAFVVYYKFTDRWDALYGSTPNVIPDFQQTTPLCTVALVSGTTYSVTLPTMLARRGVPDLTTWSPPRRYVTYDDVSPGVEPMDGQQYVLPWKLVSNLIDGDDIPVGLVQLWDETAQEVVRGTTFTYKTPTMVYCRGVALTAGTARYRLVVAGTELAATLAQVRDSLYWHDHSGHFAASEGIYLGDRIRHDDLLGLVDEGGVLGQRDLVPFRESSIGVTRNPHPQYLHRYGYCYQGSKNDGTDNEANWHNALMGPLVIGNYDNKLDLTADSFGLYFGSVSGPWIYYDQGDGVLRVSSKPLAPREGIRAVGEGLVGGSYLAEATPRISSHLRTTASNVLTCMLGGIAQDATKGGTKIYMSTSGAGGLVITTNATWLQTGASTFVWVREVAGWASKVTIGPDGTFFHFFDATSTVTWADADWSSTPGVYGGYFRLDGGGTHGELSVNDGTVRFGTPTATGSNPTAATNPLSNTLYAKNTPKVWGKITAGASATIDDGFGISSLTLGGGVEGVPANAIRLNLFDAFASRNYAPLVMDLHNPYAWGPIIYQAKIVDDQHVDIYGWMILTDVPVIDPVDLATTAVEFSVLIFGEQ